jgi:beta-lactamase class A
MNGKWESYASISNKARKIMRPQVSQYPVTIYNKNPDIYRIWNEMTGIYWVACVLSMKLNGYGDNGEVVKNVLLIATYIL